MRSSGFLSFSRNALNKSRGISLVEVVVVIGIISILLILIVPAVQRSRESARKTQCQNNLRQVGIALHSYHDLQSQLPPLSIWGPPGESCCSALPQPIGIYDRVAKGLAPDSEPSRMYANWLIMLLPHYEKGNLHSQYDFNKPVSDPDNALVRTAQIAMLDCPSDSYSTSDNLYHRDYNETDPSNFYARGNYAINFGPDRGCLDGVEPGCVNGVHVDDPDVMNKTNQLWGSGVAGVNKSFTFDDMDAGLSHVIFVDEIRAGIAPEDPRGSWALGFIGASGTARHGLADGHEDDYGPNNKNPAADDIVGCEKLIADYGEDGLVVLGMPCKSIQPNETNSQATARSMHAGGVFVLMGDNAVQFITDSVNLDIWYNLHKRDSKAVIGDDL